MHNDSQLQRLRTIEGHLKGVIKMVEDGVYCIDVIRQINAVQGALNKVSEGILRDHLNSCVTTAIRGEDLNERQRVLEEIAEVYAQSKKI